MTARRASTRSPAVADHELDPVRPLAEVHDQVAGLLGGPSPGGIQGDSENRDAPARVLYHGQDVGLGAIEKAGCEEVARQDRLGLGAQEQRPGRTCPSRRGIDARPSSKSPIPSTPGRVLPSRPVPRGSCGSPEVGFSRASRSTKALMFRRAAGQLTGPDSTGRRRRAYEHEDPPWHFVTVSPPALRGARKDRATGRSAPGSEDYRWRLRAVTWRPAEQPAVVRTGLAAADSGGSSCGELRR
jgi:hypothetical protein